MSLSNDLLDHARSLAAPRGRSRPSPADLRRSVSAAYYALFHFLIDRACRFFLGRKRESEPLRGLMARSFDHSSMKRVSAAFRSAKLPDKLLPGLGASPIPPALQKIAAAFVELQNARHRADYDVVQSPDTVEAIRLVDQAEEATALWPAVRDTPAGRLYLVALLVGDRVRD